MTTIGYGDIYPKSNIEKIYASVMALFSSAIFGYIMSSVGSIIIDMNKKNKEYNLKKAELNLYFKY